MTLDPTVNFAMQQNDVPVVKALRLRNLDDRQISGLRVRLTSEPEFASPWEARVASLAPGAAHDFGAIGLELSLGYLIRLTERLLGAVRAEVFVDDQPVARISQNIEILAYDEWSGLRSLPEILAAFVLPNHPAIETLLAKAASILESWTGDSSLSGYQTKNPKRVIEMAAAIYAALQSKGVTYISPPASFEQNGQKIRLPHRILENSIGTCLDLAVLTAGCLEQAGLNPLIVLTTGHAFAGVWLEDECFADCATDDAARVRKRVDLVLHHAWIDG